MPHLKYKYMMNEPFIGGDAASVQDSHLQIKFKKQFIYEISPEVKTLEMKKVEMVEELVERFVEHAPDINTLLVK